MGLSINLVLVPYSQSADVRRIKLVNICYPIDITIQQQRMQWTETFKSLENKPTASRQDIILLFTSSRPFAFFPAGLFLAFLCPIPALNAAVGREAWSWWRLGEGYNSVVASSLVEPSVEAYSKALVEERLTPRFSFFLGNSDEFLFSEIEADVTVGDNKDSTAVGGSGFWRRLRFFRPPAGG